MYTSETGDWLHACSLTTWIGKSLRFLFCSIALRQCRFERERTRYTMENDCLYANGIMLKNTLPDSNQWVNLHPWWSQICEKRTFFSLQSFPIVLEWGRKGPGVPFSSWFSKLAKREKIGQVPSPLLLLLFSDHSDLLQKFPLRFAFSGHSSKLLLQIRPSHAGSSSWPACLLACPRQLACARSFSFPSSCVGKVKVDFSSSSSSLH